MKQSAPTARVAEVVSPAKHCQVWQQQSFQRHGAPRHLASPARRADHAGCQWRSCSCHLLGLRRGPFRSEERWCGSSELLPLLSCASDSERCGWRGSIAFVRRRPCRWAQSSNDSQQRGSRRSRSARRTAFRPLAVPLPLSRSTLCIITAFRDALTSALTSTLDDVLLKRWAWRAGVGSEHNNKRKSASSPPASRNPHSQPTHSHPPEAPSNPLHLNGLCDRTRQAALAIPRSARRQLASVGRR
jgi:hypothetical protein